VKAAWQLRVVLGFTLIQVHSKLVNVGSILCADEMWRSTPVAAFDPRTCKGVIHTMYVANESLSVGVIPSYLIILQDDGTLTIYLRNCNVHVNPMTHHFHHSGSHSTRELALNNWNDQAYFRLKVRLVAPLSWDIGVLCNSHAAQGVSVVDG